ncbi:MAG: tetratricopeptide repeat protein [Candidatus Heimdallarchaeota archaeon]|nr:tetratricopeptide repeat protein [Candidatus Heimdallarchaeota archaeon]MDH5645123.1 tetratricopeptide repeat protein [Candidatus Heimdallarchaeota archaeon]
MISKLGKVIALLKDRLYADDLDGITQILDKNKELIEEQKGNIDLLVLKARFYRQNREYELATKIISSLKKKVPYENEINKIKVLVEYENLQVSLHRYQEIQVESINTQERNNNLNQIEELISHLSVDEQEAIIGEIALFYNLKGLYLYYTHQMAESMECFSKSISTLIKINDKYHYLIVMVNKGFCHIYIGEWKEAEYCFEQVYGIACLISDQEYRYWIYNGYLLLNLFKSNLDECISYYYKGLDIIQSLDLPKLEGDLLVTVGLIYWEQNNFTMARESFQQIMKLPMDKINPVTLALALFYQYWIYLEQENKEQAQLILSTLKSMQLRSNDPFFEYGLKVSEILLLKYSDDPQDKLEAKKELISLHEADVGNLHISQVLMILLIQLLMDEYIITRQSATLEEIFGIAKELSEIGLLKGIYSLTIDSTLIIAIIYLLNNDLQSCHRELTEALEISIQKDITVQRERIKTDYDVLFKMGNIDDNLRENVISMLNFEIHNLGKIKDHISRDNRL